MENQTALDWLLEEWPILESQIPPRIIDQAKAMETEQIINAFYDGCFDTNSWKAEQYYKENYGK